MKKILSFVMVAVLAVMLAGCNKYDDSELQRRVGELEKSMQQLLNYQTLLQKLAAGNTVTAYTTTSDVYKLTFSDGTSIEFSAQGPKGDPGKALTWDDLTQAQKDALRGAQGENGKTPKFKIENETWKVSYDDGKTWSDVGSAIDRSLIENIVPSEDGKTLLITLAGGTVIPVVYGEKEGYTFSIVNGPRKCYSFYETLESECSGEMKLYYTLTGDLSNIEDVTFVTNVTPLVTEGNVPPVGDAVKITPHDAKSGAITFKRLLSGEYGKYDWRSNGYKFDFPGMIVDIMAVFPDGSMKVQKFRFADEYIAVFPFDEETGECNLEYESDGTAWLNVSAEAGTIHIGVLHNIIESEDWELYDGAPLSPRPFSDCFYWYDTSPWYNGNQLEESYYYDGEAGFVASDYVFTVNYNANTDGEERVVGLWLIKRMIPGVDQGFVYLPIYVRQAAK